MVECKLVHDHETDPLDAPPSKRLRKDEAEVQSPPREPARKQLYLTNFLQSHSVYDVCVRTEGGVQFDIHPEYPSLYLFYYCHGDVSFDDQLVRESRGVILDQEAGWEPVAVPYIAFHEFNNTYADSMDWSSVEIFNKHDGAFVMMYRHADKWHVSSRKYVDGRDLMLDFWRVWGDRQLPGPAHHHYCFMFELVSECFCEAYPPAQERIVLTGCRNMSTMEEEHPKILGEVYQWEYQRHVEGLRAGSLAEAMALAFPLVEEEGFIIQDAQFRRVKLHSPYWLTYADDDNRAVYEVDGWAAFVVTAYQAACEYFTVTQQAPANVDELMDTLRRITPPYLFERGVPCAQIVWRFCRAIAPFDLDRLEASEEDIIQKQHESLLGKPYLSPVLQATISAIEARIKNERRRRREARREARARKKVEQGKASAAREAEGDS